MNDITSNIKRDLLNEAWYNTSLYSDAIVNAQDLLKVIFGPISSSMPYPYSVAVKFGDGNPIMLIDHTKLSIDNVFSSPFKG